MADVVDRMPCIDIVCAHGGHRWCTPELRQTVLDELARIHDEPTDKERR